MTPPLVVLNNFSQSEESQVKLMRVTFQHMFPTINVKTVKLSECRRVVLFNFNKEDGSVEMRHYAIRATPVGISRSVKKVLQAKLPDLGALQDIAQFIEGQAGLGGLSDSEAEDDNSRVGVLSFTVLSTELTCSFAGLVLRQVTLPERFAGKGNNKAQQSAMKLSELGPRLSLEIFKVEQGVNEGDILYHKFVSKTRDEAARTKAKVEKTRALKEQRKAVQEQNVKRKREEQEEAKKAYLERKRAKLAAGEAVPESDGDEEAQEEEEEDALSGAEDEEYSSDEQDADETFEVDSDEE